MMTLGPVQFVAYGFDRIDRFRGQILDELDRLESAGVIRVLDALLVVKEENGDLVAAELEDEALDDEEEAIETGELLAALLGFDIEGGGDGGAGEPDTTPTIGLTRDEILAMADDLEPGTAAGILLVEHRWATGFREAVQSAGGHPLLQGFLTPETVALIGAETIAVASALETIEAAAVAEGEALLRAAAALTVADEAERTVVSAVSAGAVQTLIDAGLLPAAAGEEAVLALADAGLFDRSLMGPEA